MFTLLIISNILNSHRAYYHHDPGFDSDEDNNKSSFDVDFEGLFCAANGIDSSDLYPTAPDDDDREYDNSCLFGT